MKPFLHKLPFLCLVLFAFGSRAQVTRLSNNTNLETGIPLGNIAVLISASDSLWRTDGTVAGTLKYANNVAMDTLHDYAILGNKIYFGGKDANNDELWVTDGTAGGTQLVKDINPGTGGSAPEHLIVFNNALYFFANNGTNGKELWKSDGTAGGTVLLKDINPGAGSSFVKSYSVLSIINNTLYFGANDGTNGVELWKSDGTAGGTVLLKDINPGSGSSNPYGFFAYGSIFLFDADNGSTGIELWKSDGSAANTVLLKDIETTSFGPLHFGSNPFGYTLFNGKVYFDAQTIANGLEGWVTDGTTAGTTLLKDINPAKSSGVGESGFPLFFNALFLNNLMYFNATGNGENAELWTSDGTGANTNLFKDIKTGAEGSNPFFLLNGTNATDINSFHSNLFNGIAFMQAGTASAGLELWKTDGTTGGTVMVKDINPGTDSSIVDTAFSYFFTPSNLYFTANDGTTGNELWKSDGTAANTTRVIDINAGGAGSDPQFVTYFNGVYLFTANDGDNANGNRDLFRLDGVFNSPLPLNLLDFTGAARDRSVRLNWSTSQEVNTAYFDVERSANGSDFKQIGKVAAQKNTYLKMNYQFDDVDALPSGGRVFYRLKMVDEDGKFKYSKIIAFSKVSEGRLLTYPNPVTDELKVTINTGNRKQLSLVIFDEGGKQVYNQRLSSLQGNNSYSINVSSFANGSYYVNIVTDGGVETAKFVKK